jgi:hypothetical protein
MVPICSRRCRFRDEHVRCKAHLGGQTPPCRHASAVLSRPGLSAGFERHHYPLGVAYVYAVQDSSALDTNSGPVVTAQGHQGRLRGPLPPACNSRSGRTRNSPASFLFQPYRVAVNMTARIWPSIASAPNRRDRALVACSVASSNRVASRASISLRSGVPSQYATAGSLGERALAPMFDSLGLYIGEASRPQFGADRCHIMITVRGSRQKAGRVEREQFRQRLRHHVRKLVIDNVIPHVEDKLT